MKMNNSRVQTYVALAAIVIMSLCLLGFHFVQGNINQQIYNIQSNLILRKKVLDQTKKQAENRLERQDVHSSSPYEKQNAASSILRHQSSQLFGYLLTYHSQSEWDSSRQKAAAMLTPEAKSSNKGAFNSGKDVTGNSIIKSEGLRSSLVTATVIPCLVNGNSISGLVKNKYMSSIRGGNNGFSIDYYYVTYDLNTSKFTEVSRLGSLGSYSDN